MYSWLPTDVRIRVGVCLLFLLIALSGLVLGNDRFVDAIEMNGLTATSTASSVGATAETGEPNYTINDTSFSSLWWKWTAPATGRLSVDLIGSQLQVGSSSFGKIIGAYVSDGPVAAVDSLALVDAVGSSTSREPGLAFPVSAGTTYYFHVTSHSSSEQGDIQINLSLSPNGSFGQLPVQGQSSLDNDELANAKLLTGSQTSALAYTKSSSIEPAEPEFLAYKSVWWRWVAPKTGRLFITTDESDSSDGSSSWGKRLAVFQGDGFAALKYCAVGQGIFPEIQMPVAAGQSYYIALASESDEGGSGVINLFLNDETDLNSLNVGGRANAENDLFSQRVKLRGGFVSAIGYGIGSGREAFEPDFSGGGSLWWSYQPASSGEVRLTTVGSDLTQNRLISIWTGNSLVGLQSVVSSSIAVQPELVFNAEKDEVYTISVGASSLNSVAGTIVLSMNGPEASKDFLVNNLTIEPAVRLRWPTVAGAVYQVRASSDLETFQDTGSSVLGDGGEMEALLSVEHGQRFFEVIIE